MTKKIVIIAGENSGDALGAELILALGANAHVSGVGGEAMRAAGMDLLFPMEDINVMGFVEVIPHIPRLLNRIGRVVKYIHEVKPDLVITIDVPDFSTRVVKKCQSLRAGGTEFVQLVAPSVWAYKPQRAELLAELYDRIFCLYPFEPAYFERAELKADFVGHPLAYQPQHADAKTWRETNHVGDAPLWLVLPGSRDGEIARHAPIFEEMLAQVAPEVNGLQVAVPYARSSEQAMREAVKSWPVPVHLVPAEEKAAVMAAADMALSKSGTVTLELALASVPAVITYRVNALSAWLIRRMKRSRFVGLPNIMAGYEIMPELLQEECQPDMLAKELLRLWQQPEYRAWQSEQCGRLAAGLRAGAQAPMEKMASLLTQ